MTFTSLLPDARWMEDTTSNTNEAGDDKIDLAASIVSNVFLFLLIFGLSATVDTKHLRHELGNKFALLTGIVMQFLIMPLLGFLSVLALRNFGLTQAMGITLLVVTASPGGSYSNWWCSTFNADLALSVAMTAVSTILSIGLLPANLFCYSLAVYGVSKEEGVLQSLDLKAIFISLAIVISAILIGLYTSYKVDSPRFHKMANHLGSISGILLVLVSIFLSSSEEHANFWSLPWTFYVGVALPCIIGLFLANLFCRCASLKKPEQVAISIECCYQNVGIATSVAVTMFDDPVERAQALSVPIFYGLVEALVIAIYCIWSWKMGWTKAPKDEKLCVVVTRTYEVGHDHDDDNEDQYVASPDDSQHAEERPTSLQVDTGDTTTDANAVPHHSRWRAWLAWPFIPRYPDSGGQRRRPYVEMAAETPKTPDCQQEGDEERCRVVSEDYTAATSTTDGMSSSPTFVEGVEVHAAVPEEEEQQVPRHLAFQNDQPL